MKADQNNKTDIFNNKQTRLIFPDIELARQLFGEHSHNLKNVGNAVNVDINLRGNIVFLSGAPVDKLLAKNILEQLYELLKKGYPVYPNDIDYAISTLCADRRVKLKDIFLDTNLHYFKKAYCYA
jgi:phosphate starvation-inducible protein PhoH and related proteins